MADDLPPGMNQMDKNLHDWFPELPAEERFIESFKCNLKKPDWGKPHNGVAYLTQNYCCFAPAMMLLDGSDTLQMFRWLDVDSVAKETRLMMSTLLRFTVNGGDYFLFGLFTQRECCFHLSDFLTEAAVRPLGFMHKREHQRRLADRAARALGGARGGSGGGAGGRAALGLDQGGQPDRAGLRARRLISESEEIGAKTLNELDKQHDQILRMNRKMDDVNHNLDRGQRYIRGISSWSGMAANAVTSDIPETPVDDIPEVLPDLEIPVVRVWSSFGGGYNSFRKTLAFRDDVLERVDHDSGNVEATWPYSALTSIEMEGTQFHMKLHFAGGDEDEMQLISNYVEDVAIALQDRTDFDVPLRLADNCTKLRVLGTEAVVHGGGGGGGGGTTATAPPRGSASTSGGLGGNARAGPPKSNAVRAWGAPVRKDDDPRLAELEVRYRQQDEDLDEISAGMSRLKDLGTRLGHAIDRDDAHLDELDTKVENTTARIQSQNKQMDKILR